MAGKECHKTEPRGYSRTQFLSMSGWMLQSTGCLKSFWVWAAEQFCEDILAYH